MEKLLKCTGYGPVWGDCTSDVYYELTRECTVKELCDYIILDKGEWGYINIAKPGTIYDGEPRIEFKGGSYVDKDGNQIEFNMPSHYADKVVKKVKAHGGWSFMSYTLFI